MGTKKSGKGRRKLGRKKRRMRAKIRHRKQSLSRLAGRLARPEHDCLIPATVTVSVAGLVLRGVRFAPPGRFPGSGGGNRRADPSGGRTRAVCLTHCSGEEVRGILDNPSELMDAEDWSNLLIRVAAAYRVAGRD